MKFTSHKPTGRLLSLREQDPELAAQVEGLCVAIRALTAHAVNSEALNIVAYANKQIQPFVEPGDAFRAAMEEKARLASRTRGPKIKRREP